MKHCILKIFPLMLVLVLLCAGGCFYSGTPEKLLVTIPDLKDVDESSAKIILANKGLIPKAEYVYSNTVAEGNVISTSPAIGSTIPPDTVVKVYVSMGPSMIYSKHSTISWYSTVDDVSFYAPYIEKGYLYIQFTDTVLADGVSWKSGGFGNASISDTFDKTVPLEIISEKMEWEKGEKIEFTIKIPITDLNVQRPTTLSVKLAALDSKGNQEDIKFSFSISW